MNRYHYFLGWRLAMALLRHPTYRVLIVADEYYPPLPWSEKIRIEVDDRLRVIRLRCELT